MLQNPIIKFRGEQYSKIEDLMKEYNNFRLLNKTLEAVRSNLQGSLSVLMFRLINLNYDFFNTHRLVSRGLKLYGRYFL